MKRLLSCLQPQLPGRPLPLRTPSVKNRRDCAGYVWTRSFSPRVLSWGCLQTSAIDSWFGTCAAWCAFTLRSKLKNMLWGTRFPSCSAVWSSCRLWSCCGGWSSAGAGTGRLPPRLLVSAACTNLKKEEKKSDLWLGKHHPLFTSSVSLTNRSGPVGTGVRRCLSTCAPAAAAGLLRTRARSSPRIPSQDSKR